MARRSLLSGLARIASALTTAAPIGGTVLGVGAGLVTILRTPQMVFHTYQNLWRTERLGPVAKTTIGIVLPIGFAIAPVAAVLGGAIAGVAYYGFWRGLTETHDDDTFLHVPFTGAAESFKAVIDFDESAAKTAWVEVRKLKDDEQPFEIRVIEGARGVLSTLLTTPYQALGLTAVTLAYWPRGVYRMHENIWKSMGTSTAVLELAMMMAMEVVGLAVAVLAIPLTPVASVLFSVVDGCVEGYKRGVRSAFGNATKRISDWRKTCKAMTSKEEPQTDSNTRPTCAA